MNTFIFDVDGTLLSTESMYMKSLQFTLANHGIHKTYEEVYAVFGLPSLDALIKFEIANPEVIQAEWQSHYREFWHEVKLFDGVREMLSALNQATVKTGIVTSNTPEEFKDHATEFEITQYFDDFVFAGQTPKMKPAADPILKSLADLDVEPANAIYIGDSVHDMQAAHNAGIKYGMAAWGVRDRDVFKDEADFIFEKPSDILKLID